MKEQKVERNELGHWTHSELVFWDEGTTRAEVDAWFNAEGLGYCVVWFESNAPDKLQEKYFEKGDPDISDWNPSVDIDGAFLVSIHDKEDGPVAVFAYPARAGQ